MLSLVMSPVVASAQVNTSSDNNVRVIGVYEGKKITSIHKIVNGKPQEVSYEEFIKDVASKKVAPFRNVKPQVWQYLGTTYSQSSGYTYYASGKKASADFGCPSAAPAPCTTAVQYTLQQQYSANASLQLVDWKAIKLTLGAQYNETVGINATYTLPIPPGKFGHVDFYPKYYHTEGTLAETYIDNAGMHTNTRYVGAELPQSNASGLLDGYALGVITDYPN